MYRALVVRGWWLVLIVLFAVAGSLGSKVPGLDVDTSTRALLNDDDPDLAYYETSRAVWGYDEYAMVCATRDTWIDAEGVKLVRELVAELAAIPHVSRVVSILDVPLLRQDPEPVTRMPEILGLRQKIVTLASDAVDYDRARDELLAHTQARGNVISASGRDLGILVYLARPADLDLVDPEWARLHGELPTRPEAQAEIDALRPRWETGVGELRVWRAALVDGVRRVAASWSRRLPEPVRLSGTPIVQRNIDEHVRHDLRVFGLVCLALFLFAFFLFYRKPRFVILPILTCLLPVAMVVGAMAVRGMKITVTTADLPLLLFVLLLPYTVYFIERYRERRSQEPDESEATSSFEAASAIIVPCLFSCLTTVAGFAALTTSHTLPIRHFGLMMAIGMAVGLITVFLALPSLFRPLPALPVDASAARQPARGLVGLFLRLALERTGLVLVGGAVILGLAVLGALRLDAQSKFTEYFWPRSEVYQGLEYIDTRLGGTTSLEIVLSSEEKGYFLKREGREALVAAASYFDAVPETGNLRSLSTLVDELEKKVPNAGAMLPLLANVGEVKALVSEFTADEHRTSRIFIRMRETAPTLDRNRILDGLRTHLASQPELEVLDVKVTGIFLLYANMLNSLIRSQRDTFLLVIAAVYLMLVLLFRSPILALVVLLPQVLPAVTVLGVLGWSGIPLDLVTVMIASIALGVGIDAAIQYTFRYRRELSIDGDRRAAIRRAHGTVGRAIWIATTVIVIGFCVLVLSQFRPSVWFGVFTAIAMLMSQVSALTVLPALLLATKQPTHSGDASCER